MRIITSMRYSCVSPSSVSSSMKTLPAESTIKTFPFSATTRRLVPCGPETSCGSVGEPMSSVERPFLAAFLLSFSCKRLCFLFSAESSPFGGVAEPLVAVGSAVSSPGTTTLLPQANFRAFLMYFSANSLCLFHPKIRAP
jgi:hypothetical protein